MKKIILCLMLCFLSACYVNQGDFTIISNKAVNLNNLNSEMDTTNVTGKDGFYIVGSILYGSENPNIGNALNDAFTIAKGDVMLDAKVRIKWMFIPFFYAKFAWLVTGDIANTKK